jgi:hypothetical protein
MINHDTPGYAESYSSDFKAVLDETCTICRVLLISREP